MNAYVTTKDQDKARIQWACRRGLLELDLLFKTFMRRGFDELDVSQRADFEHMLQHGDQELLGWMMGSASPTNRAFQDVIERIRSSVAVEH